MTRLGKLHMVHDVVDMIPHSRKLQLSFKNRCSSRGLLKGFMARNKKFYLKRPRDCEDRRVTAVMRGTVVEKIKRVDAAGHR